MAWRPGSAFGQANIPVSTAHSRSGRVFGSGYRSSSPDTHSVFSGKQEKSAKREVDEGIVSKVESLLYCEHCGRGRSPARSTTSSSTLTGPAVFQRISNNTKRNRKKAIEEEQTSRELLEKCQIIDDSADSGISSMSPRKGQPSLAEMSQKLRYIEETLERAHEAGDRYHRETISLNYQEYKIFAQAFRQHLDSTSTPETSRSGNNLPNSSKSTMQVDTVNTDIIALSRERRAPTTSSSYEVQLPKSPAPAQSISSTPIRAEYPDRRWQSILPMAQNSSCTGPLRTNTISSTTSTMRMISEDDLDAYSDAGMSVLQERKPARPSPYGNVQELTRKKRFSRNWNSN